MATTKTALRLAQQLEAAQLKVKQLKAKEQQVRARERAKNIKQERANDTRRKILIGAYILNSAPDAKIKEWMNDYLKNERDRKLFGLDPKNEPVGE